MRLLFAALFICSLAMEKAIVVLRPRTDGELIDIKEASKKLRETAIEFGVPTIETTELRNVRQIVCKNIPDTKIDGLIAIWSDLPFVSIIEKDKIVYIQEQPLSSGRSI